VTNDGNHPPIKAPAIEFRDVVLAYDDHVILDGISFAVQPGETKIVLGGSGTGKSTILKLVLGLIKPDEGHIFVDGQEVTPYSEQEMLDVRRKIGMIFQDGALFDSLSVWENVGFRLLEKGTPHEEVEEAVRRTLRFVNLEDAIEKMPDELSGAACGAASASPAPSSARPRSSSTTSRRRGSTRPRRARSASWR
jgi:phospholipid/cholesterol/gamma-HCH transport system ATP-binding protein